MSIVPKHKSDLASCKNLSTASDEEVVTKIPELLEWLQDMNWPVAPLVCERLKSIGDPLIVPLRKVLTGSDACWKYWIITCLLREAPNETVFSLREALETLANHPSSSEEAEGVHLEAREVLLVTFENRRTWIT